MQAVEFTTELSGQPTFAIPEAAAAKLPKTGRARVIVLTSEEGDTWRAGAYQQFLPDDAADDEIYESLK
jgi:hypothetical protein